MMSEEQPQTEPVECGYVVAVKPDGQFIFNPVGTNITLVSLLGLQQYAAIRIQELFDKSTGRGTSTLTKQLTDLTTTLKLLLKSISDEE